MSNEQANLNESANDTAPQNELTTVDDSALSAPQTIDIGEARRALEAVLMAASEPIAVNELRRIFDGELSADTVRNLLEELRGEWAARSVELAVVASGYRFRVKPEFHRLAFEPRTLSVFLKQAVAFAVELLGGIGSQSESQARPNRKLLRQQF